MTHGVRTLIELDDAHLERAKETLANRVAIYGLTERDESFWHELGQRYD
jgi:hypothetical protein